MEDPEPLLYGNEIIYRDGKLVGYLETGANGFTLGGAVGMGFVHHEEDASVMFINSGSTSLTSQGSVTLPGLHFARCIIHQTR